MVNCSNSTACSTFPLPGDISTVADCHSIEDPINDYTRDVLQYINCVVLGLPIGLFGIGTNICNIIVYKRLGLNESMHVTLIGLSLSDLGALVTLVWSCICLIPAFVSADLYIQPVEFQFLVGAIQHVRFMRISCWLTALVTVERSLCLVIPLRVKKIFTPRLSAILVASIFIFFLLSQITNLLCFRLDWKFYESENRSRIGISPTAIIDDVRKFNLPFNFLLQFLSMIVILVGNLVLLHYLRQQIKKRASANVFPAMFTLPSREPECSSTQLSWNHSAAPSTLTPAPIIPMRKLIPREATIGGSRDGHFRNRHLRDKTDGSHPSIQTSVAFSSRRTTHIFKSRVAPLLTTTSEVAMNVIINSEKRMRERKLSRMIVILSAIMIVAYTPSTVLLAIGAAFDEFTMGRKLHNSFIVAYSFSFVIEAINASANIFIYYYMSSNFKTCIKKLFGCRKKHSLTLTTRCQAQDDRC